MIKDITLGQYIPGESMLHRADPRTKIILIIVFMVALFLIKAYLGYIIYALFTLLVIMSTNIPVKYTLKGLRPILFIVVFAAVINVFSASGTVIWELGVIHVTMEGIHTAVRMAVTLVLLVVVASLLTFTTSPIALTDGIEKLLSPLKRVGFPAHEIAMMMTIALRFIPTLLEETDKIMKAQASRGADFDTGNLLQRAKSFIPVLVPLFVSAFRRADELASAMEARCYRGDVGRTRMKQIRLGKVDLGLVGISLIFITGMYFLGCF